MLSWSHVLPFLLLQPLFIGLVFGWKKKRSKVLQTPVQFLVVLLLYNTPVIYWVWVNTQDQFFLAVALAQFSLLVLFILVLLNRQKFSWLQQRKSLKAFFPVHGPNQKYEKTGLSTAFSLELRHKLEQLMVTEKPYLNQELHLDDIAHLLNISKHHASQVINENFGVNFYEFVNKYRIEEAKFHLVANARIKSLSISEIAFLCGFNNRVSFYKAFKKEAKSTPTEFMEHHINATSIQDTYRHVNLVRQ